MPLPYPQHTIEKLRTAVKQLGKEAATHRFTVEEKRALKSIAFEYANKDVITSENEITRIAVNFLLDDYRVNREKSLLARVLDGLNTETPAVRALIHDMKHLCHEAIIVCAEKQE